MRWHKPGAGVKPGVDPRWRLAAIFAVSSLTVMSSACIAPALTGIARAFGDTERAAFWVRLSLTFPTLFSAIGAPLAGRMIDRYGRRRPLIVALWLYAVAGTAGGLAINLPMLIVSRALLGCAIAVIMVTSITLIADYYDETARRRVLGWQSGVMSVGGFAYLCLGGLLADVDWRAAFAIYAAALAILPLVVVNIREPTASARSRGTGADGPGRTHVPQLSATIAFAFVGMIAFYMVPVHLPFYLAELDPGISAFATGWAVAFMPLSVGAAAMCYVRVRQWLDVAATFVLIFVLLGVGYLWIGQAASYGPILVGLVIAGAGVGLLFPHLSNTATACATGASRGQALGLLNTGVFLGQFISPLATQPVLDVTGVGGAYGVAGGVCLAIAALCVVAIGVRTTVAVRAK